MTDLFAVLLMAFFAIVGLYIVGIIYVVRMLRNFEDRVRILEELLE